jgi:aspartate oxidase
LYLVFNPKKSEMGCRIIIAGGGVAGLTLANALEVPVPLLSGTREGIYQ